MLLARSLIMIIIIIFYCGLMVILVKSY